MVGAVAAKTGTGVVAVEAAVMALQAQLVAKLVVIVSSYAVTPARSGVLHSVVGGVAG